MRLIKMHKMLVVSITTLGVLAVPTTAFADLTVTKPCGCQPVQDQPVGNAPNTPAADNPTGTVGNADNANRVWTACALCQHNSSAVVDFNG